MARIYQSGALNTMALAVPDLYVQIMQPQTLLNGAPSGRVGLVGTAAWGPVDTPAIIGTMQDYLLTFGEKQNRPTDMGVAVNVMALQGGSDFRCVRITDGTDQAAFASLAENVFVTARYTGTLGNRIIVTVTQSAPSLWRLEVFHPVLGSWAWQGGTWQAIAEAMNADPSVIVALSGPALETPPTSISVTLSGGRDGDNPDLTDFIGMEGALRTGMFALRGQGCSIGLLHGLTIGASWNMQAEFGLSEGLYMIASGPSGENIMQAVAAKQAAGLDSYAVKLMLGDWLWWNDDTHGMMLVSPAPFAAGKLAALSPERSSLNKPLSGVTGSQKTGRDGSALTYSNAELTALFDAGIDVICTPAPGGAYWAVRAGHNSSSRAATNGDHYTRLTNYIASSLASGMGSYVGEIISDTLFGDVRATILGLLSSMLDQGILGLWNGSLPYSVICDESNNPQNRVALGYVQCDVAIRYQGINEKFIVNLQGGASVSVSKGVVV